MLRYALRRLLQLVPTLLGVTLLTFILFNVVGGSPAAIVLGKNATAEALADYDRARLRQAAADPLRPFLGDLLRCDLGTSIEYHQPAWHVIRDGVLVSLSLTVPILVIGTVLALLVGLLCAATANRLFDKTALAFTTALMSVNYVIW